MLLFKVLLPLLIQWGRMWEKAPRIWVRMGPRLYELGHHKWCEKSETVRYTTCDGWYYFFAYHTMKMLTDVIQQSFTGKPRTVLIKIFLQEMLSWELFCVQKCRCMHYRQYRYCKTNCISCVEPGFRLQYWRRPWQCKRHVQFRLQCKEHMLYVLWDRPCWPVIIPLKFMCCLFKM